MNDYTELKSDLEEHCGRLGVLAVNALEAQAAELERLTAALAAQPAAPQPPAQPAEPIAWMFGASFWGTYEAIPHALREKVRPLYAAPQPPQDVDDARDAERYRWLRKQDNDDFRFAVIQTPHFDVYESPEALDAAIDAAAKGQ